MSSPTLSTAEAVQQNLLLPEAPGVSGRLSQQHSPSSSSYPPPPPHDGQANDKRRNTRKWFYSTIQFQTAHKYTASDDPRSLCRHTLMTSAKKAADARDTGGQVTTSEVSLHELFC